MDETFTNRCTRCHTGRLRRWHELNEEEQLLARRLPASADFSLAERKATHSWCTRCWHEEAQSESHDA